MPNTNTTTTQAPVNEAAAIQALRQFLATYVDTHATDDVLDACMHGKPFVADDRVYVQLAGRTGQGLLTGLCEVRSGWHPWLSRKFEAAGEPAPAKGEVKASLAVLGFERKPFSYRHPTRGQSSASYYSAPVEVLGEDA
jgi:hypothetical protein